MPMVVEFGVALDVLVAVLVLGIFFFQIREQFDSLDLHHLELLKERTRPDRADGFGEDG
jgi:hydrogenase-4 component E